MHSHFNARIISKNWHFHDLAGSGGEAAWSGSNCNSNSKHNLYERNNTMADKQSCMSKNHKMHTCALKASGYDKKNVAEFKKLTADPQYKCDNCGAKAHASENLCKPVKL